MTDSQLIREIKDGNIEAYGELVHRYERKIYLFILQILKGQRVDLMAEDLCQDTFYKAFRSLSTFREEEASFSTWLYTIARNTVLSELRKARNGEVYLEDSGQTPKAPSEGLPESSLLRNEKVMMVREAINSLPENQRSALILREYDQMDYKQIADIMGMTISSVKSLLFRARASIRHKMEDYVMESVREEAEG
jgi:RNA polymerase sigma factor (sigma-70 family)